MEFKGTRLEKLYVSFSIYLLLSLSLVLLGAAETKPFRGSITIRDINDPQNMEVILDKYSQDALTVMELDVETCATTITCGASTCETPYYEIIDDGELPKDAEGNEKHLVAVCDYINSNDEHITFVLDPQRWTSVAVKYLSTTGLSLSDTKLEYYLMDQTKYSVVNTDLKGDVKILTIQNAQRLKETIDDSTSTFAVLCSADLLGEAKIECNEQMMEIYAIVATYWYFVTHFWEFILASLQTYKSICSVLSWLKNKFGELFTLLGGSQNEYAQKLAQYYDAISGLVSDAYELYEEIYAYYSAAMACKDAYQYIKDLYDSVLGLIAKIKGYLSFLENPIPSCISTLTNKLQSLISKLKGLIPDLSGLSGFLSKLNLLYPSCIQNFLAKLSDFQNLLSRFQAVFPNYCSKVQTMKAYYEDPAKGNDPVMANKYAVLYVPCEDGSWTGLSLSGIPSECTSVQGLALSGTMPTECQNLMNLDLSASLSLPSITLPQSCTDFKSILDQLVFCDEIDLDTYKDKYPGVPGDVSADC